MTATFTSVTADDGYIKANSDGSLPAIGTLVGLALGRGTDAKLNRSFGLTTLRDRHARVEGTAVRFRFRGKAGRQHEVGLRDRRLAAVVRRCQELPGQECKGGYSPGEQSENYAVHVVPPRCHERPLQRDTAQDQDGGVEP